MKKKGNYLNILSICLLIVLAAMLGGCAGNTSSGGGKGNEKNITLRILIWNNNPEGTKLEQTILKEFEKENPGVKVKTVYAPYDKFNEKFLTMTSGGDQPDLTWIQPSAFGEFVDKGVLVDLSDRVKAEINKDELLPNILELGQVDGKQYALIRDASAFQIGYNKDLFDEAGVPYPKDDWTWEDFLETAEKLTKVEKGKTVQFGFENFYTPELLTTNGGGYVSADGKKVMIDSPESIEAIEFGRDLIHKYHVQPTSAQSQGLSNMFLSGKAAMKLMGPWDWANTAKNANFEWDVVPLPAGKAGNVANAAYLPIGIGKDTKHLEEAWELLKFLTYGKGQDLQLKTISAVSVLKRNADKITGMKNAPANANSLANTLMEGKTVLNAPYIPKYSDMQNKIQTVIDNINLKNVKDVEGELKKIAEKIRKEYNLQ